MTSTSISPESGFTVILDTADLTENFMITLGRYEQKTFKQQMSNLTKEQAFAIIHAIVDDVLNLRMRWAKNTLLQEDAVEQHVQWTGKPSFRPQRNRLFQDIVDAYEITIQGRLDQFMDRYTWDIWTTRVIGKDVVLIKGMDYRVFDWERRMKNGEWQDESLSS